MQRSRLLAESCLRLGSSNIDEAATVLTYGEDYGTVNESIESVVFTHAYIEAG